MKLLEWINGLTLHGIRHIFSGNGNKFSRLFWIAAIVTSISGLCFNYHLLYLKFDKTPDINVRIKHRFTSEIPFPAITVCIPLFAKNSLVKFFNISKQIRLNPGRNLNLTAEEENYLASNIHACSPDLGRIIIKSPLLKRTEFNVVKLLNESFLSLSEAVLNCYYKGSYLDCSNILNRVLTDRGYCFSFNMQGFNTIFNEKIVSKDFHCYRRVNITKSFLVSNKLSNEKVQDENEPFQWSLDYGYAQTHESDSIPVKARKGKLIKFNPYLREIDATNVCTVYGNVFSMFLHLPNEIMLSTHRENYVEFKKKKDTIVTAKSFTADDSMRKFTPEARGCYFEGEKQLKFFKTYTKALCEFECMTNYTLKICGCVKFSMPRTSSMPVCSIEKIDCYLQAINNWPDYSKTQNRFEITCECLKTCNYIEYDVKYEKSSTTENVLLSYDLYNITRSDSVSSLSFMFDEFEILEFEEYATYKLQNFVADLGGLLGFFLGCSALSIIEMGYFALEIIISKLKAFCTSSKEVSPPKLETSADQQINLNLIKSLKKISDETYINPVRLYKPKF